MQLLTTFEIWTQAVEDGNPVDANYLDFQKASDSVPHKRLIRKLAAYAGLAKFDWKVVAQWATKDINLVAQQ